MTVLPVSFLYFILSESRIEPEAVRPWGWEGLGRLSLGSTVPWEIFFSEGCWAHLHP